ncbi:TetR/AcrR family transcriptional regulator [Paenibacillus tyrfis]|uniref:TetR family transcriptional regulator n=1 Tax=Paenibacillus tyrfis TaxID=1501230 RepID=A0A081P145_9BACL|nr:TetR/AcrR family transcriptional regulator [Paenibacillus tyrfis]KEQ24418.1 TetR family transcriptional regulator [Paenibacillus tyrfis]
MPRIAKDPQERRKEILDAAEELFRQKGYEHTSTIDIVKKMKVAQGTLYYYFESKEALADALVDRQLGYIYGMFARVAYAPGLSAYHKIAWVMAFELDDPYGHNEMFSYLHHPNNAVLRRKADIQMICRFTSIIADIITQGNEEQLFSVSNPTLIAEFFLTSFHQWINPSLFDWTKEERIVRITAIQPVLEGLFGVPPGTFELALLREKAAVVRLS